MRLEQKRGNSDQVMNDYVRSSQFLLKDSQPARLRGSSPVMILCLVAAIFFLAQIAQVKAAQINNIWWTYEQDCNGNGAWAGQLPGNLARLNWTPVATNCDGNVLVWEVISVSPCGLNEWTPIFTNAIHEVNGCSIENSSYYDVQMGSNGVCHDYQIAIYKTNTAPDNVYNENTPVTTNCASCASALGGHKEKLLSQDVCLDDFFATAANISGSTGSRLDDNTFATKEPGEPNHAGNPGGKSLWYFWTATNNIPLEIDTIGSSFDTLLAVYTGTNVAALSVVTSNDDISGANNRFSSVTFTPVAGTTYHIAVDGFGGASGLLQLNWNQSGVNLPDLIVWGPSVTPSVFTNTFTSTSCEVVEGCEPVGTRTLLSFTTETRNIGTGDLVMGNPATNSLFHWATCHQHYHFEQFAAYTLLDTNNLDTNGNPTVVATGHKVGFCLEDVLQWNPNAPSNIRYNCTNQGIQAGWADIYYGNNFYPAPYNNGLPCQYIDITGVAPGDYVLQIVINPDNVIPESNTNNNITLVPVNIPPPNCDTVPPNDNFANAIIITNLPFVDSQNTQCATKQTGEPNIAGGTGGHSVWYSWTAPANQTVVVNTKPSSFDTTLGVFTGNTVSTLTSVASNDDIIPNQYVQSSLSFAATAGTTYHIGVDGFGGAYGAMTINVGPPVNDDFYTPTIISGTSGSITGFNFAGSKEPTEPAHAGDVGGHSIWYFWTAPSNGPVDINTQGSDFDTTMGIYTGGTVVATNGDLTNLVTVVANHNDPEAQGAVGSRCDFTAVKGTTYEIAIDGFGGVTGNTVLNWNMESRVGITQSNGVVQLTLTGVDWQRYSLLGSTNLTTWTTNIAPITMAEGLHVYTNIIAPGSNGASPLFYKGYNTGQ